MKGLNTQELLNHSRVLVVDDVPSNLDLVCKRLTKVGIDTVAVSSGEEALALLDSQTFDLVILDYMMPVMDGIDTLTRMRKTWSSIELPVIMLTAKSEEEGISDSFAAGANDYMTKPIDFNVLITRINSHIGLRNLVVQSTQEADQRAREESARASALLANTPTAIITISTDGMIQSFNPAAEKMFGFSYKEVLHKNITILMPSDTAKEHDQYLKGKNTINFTSIIGVNRSVEAQHKNGTLFPIEIVVSAIQQGDTELFSAMITDISQKVESENLIRKLALTDSLTGLNNRHEFMSRAEKALKVAKRHDRVICFAFIDLDGFKIINDGFGHQAGDQVLIQVAKAISCSIRETDFCARIGGDEFAVALCDMREIDNYVAPITKILTNVNRPVIKGANKFQVSASIGISFYPNDGGDLQELVRRCDVAMYQAKEAGKNCYRIYDANIHNKAMKEQLLMMELKKCLEGKPGLSMHFQPQIDLDTNRAIGFEALIRWQHQTLGYVSPVEFIPLAEKAGLIQQLGQWTLVQAINFYRSIDIDLPDDFAISINVSPIEFKSRDYVKSVQAIVDEQDIDCACLKLEITENMIVDSTDKMAVKLQMLRELGFRLSIDDFGTGYSSLSYLKRLPVDELKIDRSFIMDVPKEGKDTAITDAIITMGNALGLRIIAEGVEEENQHLFVKTRCKGIGQGYFYSKPLPANQALQWLKEFLTEGPLEPAS